MKVSAILASIKQFASRKNAGDKSLIKKKSSGKTLSQDNMTPGKVTQIIHGEATTFDYTDFADLKRNTFYDRFYVGEISLPSGKVVCTDPLYGELALPQSWAVSTGRYPVYLYIGMEEYFLGRVAYAEMVIRDEVPDYWRFSLIEEELLTDDLEKKINGLYPVERGLSCFADVETFRIFEQEMKDFYSLHKDGNFYNDILEIHFKKNAQIPQSSRGEDWIVYQPEQAKGNIVMFGSGYGDGLYPRYVGFDKDGNVVKFVTSFIQIHTPGK